MPWLAPLPSNNDLGFPNNDILPQLEFHDPDVLFFSRDQIYEGVGGYDPQRAPVGKATLDYLRKWYIFGWTFATSRHRERMGAQRRIQCKKRSDVEGAISHVWPRRWYPSMPGTNRKPDSSKHTGDFEDGFGKR